MKSFSLLLVLSALVAGAFVASAQEFRTWHTIGGGHFEAKLTGVDSNSVTLENRDGKSIEFPLGDLKPSDQKFAREWQSSQGEENPFAGTAAAESVERTAFAEKVYKDLVAIKGSRLKDFDPAPDANPKYFAFYKSALWCPPCRAFTPKLVEFYDEQKKKGASFELVFISSDRDEDSMEEYMADYEMSWPAFEHGENKDIVKPNGGGIPNLIVTDANGKKLLDSYDDSGDYIGPTRVMKELEALLGK